MKFRELLTALLVVMLGGVCVLLLAETQPTQAAPDFERIERVGDILQIEDTQTKTIHIRCEAVTWVCHWQPGKHPEGRPFDTIEVGMAAANYRLDCKRSEDAERILELLFQK